MVPIAGSDQAYDRMTELAISSERFDRECPARHGGLRRYVICSTQRSGSFLMCRQLINAGMGVPQEYFNRLHWRLLCSRWNIDPGDPWAYLARLHASRTTSNAVWGAKLHWPQFQAWRPVLETGILDACRFVVLHRSDEWAQAVSLHIAAVTGMWGFDGTVTTAPRRDIRLGDLRHVVQCAHKIRREREAWRALLESRHVTPLEIRYEDFAADQPGFVRRLAQSLGLDESSYRIPPPERRENRLPPEIEAARADLLERIRSPAPVRRSPVPERGPPP